MSGSAHVARLRLRTLLAGPGLVTVPGVATALHARLATAAGFDVIFATGSGIANTIFGLPDLGLLSMREVVDMTRHIVEATTLPVIADADTGYGNHLNAVRTMHEMEGAGVAAIVIEDQVAPKRCGHFEGKAVVPVRQMIEKLIAITRSREDPDLVIVARSDAIATEGLASAIRRAQLYVAAGADVIFIEAPRSVEEISEIPPQVPAPCLLNVVEGGSTPLLPAAELEAAGYRFALHANLALRVSSAVVEEAFAALRRDGSSQAMLDRLQSWKGRQASVDLGRWQALDAEIGEAAASFLHREQATNGHQEAKDGIA